MNDTPLSEMTPEDGNKRSAPTPLSDMTPKWVRAEIYIQSCHCDECKDESIDPSAIHRVAAEIGRAFAARHDDVMDENIVSASDFEFQQAELALLAQQAGAAFAALEDPDESL